MRYPKQSSLGIFLSIIAVSVAINHVLAAGTSIASGTPKQARPAFSYRIAGSDRHAFSYDAKPEIQGYATLAFDSYSAALADARLLKAAIDAFLASPNDESLVRARDIWVNARRSWERTEAFRFYDGPIDQDDNDDGPRERLDGWPIDPEAIDYTEGNPTAGIINTMKLALTRATLLGRETQTGPGHAVTTGWHAIEFLLWGQDSAAGEPGDRPVTDYLAGQPNNDRRRAYLKLISDLLIEDLQYLVDSWEPKSHNYAAAFRLMNQREALGRMMNGIAQLAGQELAINRLAAILDSRDQRMLTSRFSGASYDDFVFALRGVQDVWTGDLGGQSRAGLELLISRADPPLAQRISHALNHAEESVAALRTPLERETLPAAANSPARQIAERAIADLKLCASLIRDAGTKLGVLVTLPN